MTTTTLSEIHGENGIRIPRLGIRLRNWIARQRAAEETHAALARLDDRSLADIGLTRGDVPRIVRQVRSGSSTFAGV